MTRLLLLTLKDYNKMTVPAVCLYIRNAGQRIPAAQPFFIHTDCPGGKSKAVRTLGQADQIGSFDICPHQIPEFDIVMLFYNKADHCQTGSSTISGIMLFTKMYLISISNFTSVVEFRIKRGVPLFSLLVNHASFHIHGLITAVFHICRIRSRCFYRKCMR